MNIGQQHWQVIAGACETPGGEDAPVYGIQVIAADGTVWRWQDVAADRQSAQQLADILQQAQPEPCHWAELAGGGLHHRAVFRTVKKPCFCGMYML